MIIGDLFLINASIFIAFYIRFGAEFPAENFGPFIGLMPWITLMAVVIFPSLHLYAAHPVSLVDASKRVILGIIFMGVGTMAMSFWFRGFAFPRSVLVLAAAFQFVLLCTWRAAFWAVERRLQGERLVLIVAGSSQTGYGGSNGPFMAKSSMTFHEMLACPFSDEEFSLIRRFLNVPRGWFRLHAVVPYDLRTVEAELGKVDAILLAPSVPAEAKTRIAAVALKHGREIFVVPGLYEILLFNAQMGQVDDLPVIEVPAMGLSLAQHVSKRALDLVVTLTVLILVSPLMLAAIFLIWLTSRGPILYRQERIGLGGSPFIMYKFRTMIPDAEAESGPVLATADDPRVTWVGHWLRATRLDELPQLFNVLKGEMSLVGPRPERPHFVAQFTADLAEYPFRVLVKPGITGLAQVMGRYCTEVGDKLRYDLYYIRSYSLFLDLKILFQTIRVIFNWDAARGKEVIGISAREQAAAVEMLRLGYHARTKGRPADPH